MTRLATTLAIALATLSLAASAQAAPSEYGIETASASLSTQQAGAHPDFASIFGLKREPGGALPATTKDLLLSLPPGLLGNLNAVPKCPAAQLINTDIGDKSNATGCPQDSQVGVTYVELFIENSGFLSFLQPVYNMEPRYGEPARFGFMAQLYPILIDTELRSDSDYGATAKVEGQPGAAPLLSAETTLWGVPADESHDSQRITPYEGFHGGTPETPTGEREAVTAPVPFMLNPARCGVAQGVDITAIPYALPTLESKAFAPLQPNSGCGLLDFKPEISITPTTRQAETGSGLDVDLTFPTDGYEHPNLLVGAIRKRVEVTLPEGVTVNPSQAVGLDVCSEAAFEHETALSGPDEGCPETSKIGSVTAKSPLLEETAEGSLFIAKPYENPFDSLIALYLVLKIPERGVVVKLPAKVVPDPTTGQPITTFGEPGHEIPQLPVSSFHLHFREGARSPLVTPPTCGTYESTATFTAWSGQVVTTHPSFQITSGVNGGPCPSGTPPFRPGFHAGTINNYARLFSPGYLRLTRRDGDQDLTKFSATFPPGALAKLKGVSKCPDAAIEAAKAKTGTEELANPSCPPGSEIGNVLAGAGVGQVLTYAKGKLYLAGLYHGSKLSVAAIVPAVAGPFDVGTVVTRQALSLDPDTGQAQVDGSRSDPIPHILAGIPLKVRDIRVYVDRPDFTLNPTNCDPLAFKAQIWGGGPDVFSSIDDFPVSLSARFQAANCALLGFKPRLKLKLKGGTRRGAHPALRAVLKPRKGDANLSYAQVTLPRSAFIEQSHFRTICTRVQFSVDQCPKGSVYGHVRAFSPLLDEPLEGAVYLRSSSHKLPDLVFALKGIVDINVVGMVDSFKGRLRSTFARIPDAPVSKVVLTMQGGEKGLFVNSTNLCNATQRATAKFTAQNAKRHNFNPVVANSCESRTAKHGKGGTRHPTHPH
jgi:hypothetical protein